MGVSLLPDISSAALWLAGIDPAERARAIEAFLMGPSGADWRRDIGAWIARIVPVESLVSDRDRRWRPLVQDAIQFVFSRLSESRLAAKLADQIDLPSDTPAEKRLILLISKMPGLQKIGQVLARNRHLSLALRTALSELENGMSDITWEDVCGIITKQLGARLEEYHVRLGSSILSEASVSAVVRFTWKNPNRERERAVFKVMKPYVPSCFAEDMTLLQELGEYLASRERGYDFAVHDVKEMLAEVRLMLEHELDFAREQDTLAEALRTYRSSLGIRVPRVIPALCTPELTAMSEETGVKVTDAFRRSPIRRIRIAEQLIEALLAIPLFSGRETSVFHADPHAGNLLYDESNRELIVLDWALAERLSLETRRHLLMLGIMMILRNPEGVREAIHALRTRDALRTRGEGRDRNAGLVIDRHVSRFFENLADDYSPGVLDAMKLLDRMAIEGVHFAAPLFLFRKSLFTLDSVLQDVVGSEVRIDQAMARHFMTRWVASFGLFYAPLRIIDCLSLEWNALMYPVRRWELR